MIRKMNEKIAYENGHCLFLDQRSDTLLESSVPDEAIVRMSSLRPDRIFGHPELCTITNAKGC